MRRDTGLIAVAPIVLPGGLRARPSSTQPGPCRTRTKVSPDNQKWPSGIWQMARWPIALPLQKEHTRGWECSATSRRCDKGEPVVRRGRKATGLLETAGLPNRGSVCAAKSAFIL
jgi:hypothetical protein